ncbi:MAG: outer membrane beta-barrel protein [Bacteroidales bacterium]|nr:outer membrane beta-barrel protein [Bacteroidales bacterium]
MKKVLMTLALVAVAATSAFAQFSVGAGYLQNTQKDIYTSGSTTTITPTTTQGFYAGADYAFDLGQGLGLTAGLKGSFLFGEKTVSLLGASATGKSTEIYIAVPIQCNYTYAITNDFKVFGFAGPTFAMGLSSKVKTTNNITDDVNITDNYADGSNYSRTNLFLGAGVGVDLMNTIRFKFGYDIGLLDRDNRDDYKVNDAQLYFGVAYLF